ncbi:MAG: flagellar FlbD family protein [Cellulosilyticum sp.]|nr:flagellar FlbD family protein [Cellulosilyticum sp.]
MIILTKLNDQEFTINADLIETMEQTPDTVIVMTTGNKYVVRETPEEVIQKIIEFKRKIHIK